MKTLAWLFVSALLGTGSIARAAPPAPLLIYSNDVLGEIEPCGCRNNPLGGYIRKAKFLETLKPAELLQLDAGDLFFSSVDIPSVLKNQTEQQARKHAKILKMLGHHAVVPGEKDFALGEKVYRSLTQTAGVKVLAANLKNSSGKTVYGSSHIFTLRAGTASPLKVAVLGLVSPRLAWPNGMRAEDPIEVAKVEVPKLKKAASWVIVLTHQSIDEDKKLAESVSGIDVLVGGHTQSFLQTPLVIGKTTILESSFRNQYVGAFKLERSDDPLNHRLVGLDVEFGSTSEDRLKKSKTALIEDEVIGFREQLAQIEKTRLEKDDLDSKDEKFHTFPKCADCHTAQFDFWRKTKHVLALEPLIEKKALYNLECIGCHSVGLGDPEGYRDPGKIAQYRADDTATKNLDAQEFAADLKAMYAAKDGESQVHSVPMREWMGKVKKAWAPVQCENCHSPGRSHPFGGTYTKKVETAVCLSCHRKERAPEWYNADGNPKTDVIEAKRKLVSCPAGALGGNE